MIFLLTPQDIPYFWDAIKKSESSANEVDEKDLPAYLNELLHSLLSSTAQCFVRMDENRVLEALAVTRILHNRQRNEKYLYVQSLFSWVVQTSDVWQKDMDFMEQFARSEGCTYISCHSRNPAAWRIYNQVGLVESTREFILEL